MKKTRFIVFFLLLGLTQTSEAQFLKKLKKRVEEKVEQTVVEKTADKASEKASNSMDKIFDINLKNTQAKGKKVDAKNVPDSYHFSYKYQMKMITSSGEMDVDYFLEPDATYMGMKMDAGMPFFMVIDDDANATFMFMESGGNKVVTATSLEMNEDLEDIEDIESPSLEDLTITDLPNKTFLGYDCIGKKFENDEYAFVSYSTVDAPVSFDQVFKSEMDRYPEPIKEQFKNYKGALLMHMEMIDKTNKGKKNTSGTMECVAIEALDYKFSTKDYLKL
ncbi:DUF4412 domain-containing protein [Gaetbulibacter sp. NE]|uniref:DUF4412 domain-containing protein n=1 Tax=Gaetbulibacter sp. NE TaxID=2982307 RepID=UPI0021D1111C|nr:DUF4412 domain-containing protein [Gaetbulibacter sp. NE]